MKKPKAVLETEADVMVKHDADLDLDDVAATSQKAKAELYALRSENARMRTDANRNVMQQENVMAGFIDPSWIMTSDYPRNFLPAGSIEIGQANEDGDFTVKWFYDQQQPIPLASHVGKWLPPSCDPQHPPWEPPFIVTCKDSASK